MVILTFKVQDSEGKEQLVNDYYVMYDLNADSSKEMHTKIVAKKITALCAACDQPNLYSAAGWDYHALIGEQGLCRIKNNPDKTDPDRIRTNLSNFKKDPNRPAPKPPTATQVHEVVRPVMQTPLDDGEIDVSF